MNCPICCSVNNKIEHQLYDDRYAYPGIFSVLRCSSCKHLFLENTFKNSDISNLYTNYYPRSSFDINLCSPHQISTRLKSWLNGERSASYRWVSSNIKVLDIGCGLGQSLGYHQKRGCDAYGIDADENLLRAADKYSYNVNVGVFVKGLYEDESFDYITLDQVIEHVIEPREIIQEISKILKSNGHVVISTPNSKGWGARLFGKYWIHWHVPYHLHYFSNNTMASLVEGEGFVIEKTRTITNSEWLYYQCFHVVNHPRLGEKSKYWNEPDKIPVPKIIIHKVISLLHKLKLFHAITRLFDSIGLGDNKVYILKKKS